MTTSIKLDRSIGSAAAPKEKSLHEQMLSGATMKDLNDTMGEFYSCNDEMWSLVKDLPIDERKALNGVIKDYLSSKKK